jgi:ABC-2 type transport system permease protein
MNTSFSSSVILGQRALRESLRTPDSVVPTLFIPLFFLVVNIGQAGRIFPSEGTEFLNGQKYAAFQLPASLLLAASFGSAALYLVEEIEGGYFDKMRATPIPRMSIVLGRLYAEFVKALVITSVMILISLALGVRIETGILGFLLLVVMVSVWAMVFSGFMQLIAIKTRSAAATQAGGMVFFPLLFLTPNFVPRDMLTRPMEIAATLNPVTYVMEAARALILDGFEWEALAKGGVVIAAAAALMLALSVRLVNNYD